MLGIGLSGFKARPRITLQTAASGPRARPPRIKQSEALLRIPGVKHHRRRIVFPDLADAGSYTNFIAFNTHH